MFPIRCRRLEVDKAAQIMMRVSEIAERHASAFFTELNAELAGFLGEGGFETLAQVGGPVTTAAAIGTVGSGVWSLGNTVLSGDWKETGRSHGVTHPWPDGQVSTFAELVSYQGEGGYAPMQLALGQDQNDNVVGFVISATGRSKRGLTVFFRADDFATTNEAVSFIRGGGPRGRSGFDASDALPKAYAAFKVEMLGDRVAGKFARAAVVADADDHKTMLAHTALQARLRGLA